MQQTGSVKRRLSFWRKLFSFIRDRNGWGGSQIAWHLTYWRRFIFVIWAVCFQKQIAKLLDFFEANSYMSRILTSNLSILDQATRQWFYYQSTTQERVAILEEHFSFLQNRLTKTALMHIYLKGGLLLWSQQYQGERLSLTLHYDRFYRKEGLAAVSLTLGRERLYSVSFWTASNSSGELSLWVGSLQGSRGEKQIIHDLTKHFFGYRPKNLMIFTIRVLAGLLKVNQIYAVSNYGSYVNHRLHSNRRLKTSLDEFWKETGGQLFADLRFFELPTKEYRKSLEKIPSHKRNQYRKRFTALDTINEAIAGTLEPHLIRWDQFESIS